MGKDDLQRAFDGAKLKVERANRHIDELKSALDELARNKPDGMAITKQADGTYILNFHDLGPKSAEIPLIAGDAIHNLRSALDHVWMGLCREAGVKGFQYFPFHETRKNLETEVRRSPVKQTFPDVEDLILNRVKPCGEADGDRVLWAITKYDKIDKHNLILPTARVDWIEHLIVRDPLPGGMTLEFRNGSIAGFAALVSSDGPIEYEQKGKVTFEITFPEDKLLPGEPILPTLLYMSEATRKAVELFQETFL